MPGMYGELGNGTAERDAYIEENFDLDDVTGKYDGLAMENHHLQPDS